MCRAISNPHLEDTGVESAPVDKRTNKKPATWRSHPYLEDEEVEVVHRARNNGQTSNPHLEDEEETPLCDLPCKGSTHPEAKKLHYTAQNDEVTQLSRGNNDKVHDNDNNNITNNNRSTDFFRGAGSLRSAIGFRLLFKSQTLQKHSALTLVLVRTFLFDT